jgi:RNA polymerase sigma-70 factor, ECF subfamily
MNPGPTRSPQDETADAGFPAGESASVCADRWRTLFLEIAGGSMRAVEALYEESSADLYGLAVWRTGSEEDARDVLQEVFVKIVDKRRTLSGVKDPRGWLFTLAHRAAVDVVRRRKRRRIQAIEETHYLIPDDAAALPHPDAVRASSLLVTLPPAQRAAVYLRHFCGCTFREIGSITRVPTFSAASRYRLGMRRLRILMEAKP